MYKFGDRVGRDGTALEGIGVGNSDFTMEGKILGENDGKY
jgi:hypothetical protein